MTTVQKLIKKFENMTPPEEAYGKVLYAIIMSELERSLQDEEQMLKTAIHFALDEDGHTGEWRVRFAQKYYERLKTKDK